MSESKTLLVELFTEELPPKALPKLGAAFAEAIVASLVEQGFAVSGTAFDTYATPRRLAVSIPDVAARSPDKPFRQKLLPVSVGYDASGQPTQALVKKLAALGLSTTIADARFMKPLDTELVLKLARDHEILITIEEGSVGGFGSHVAQYLTDQGALDGGMVKFRSMVLPDVFQDHDTPAAMYGRAGLDAKGIVAKVFEALGKDVKTETVKLA